MNQGLLKCNLSETRLIATSGVKTIFPLPEIPKWKYNDTSPHPGDRHPWVDNIISFTMVSFIHFCSSKLENPGFSSSTEMAADSPPYHSFHFIPPSLSAKRILYLQSNNQVIFGRTLFLMLL